jgi:hypothetical protein
MATEYRPIHCCWICGQEVQLQSCKTDEHGSAVHESCYIARTKMEAESARPPLNRGFINET